MLSRQFDFIDAGAVLIVDWKGDPALSQLFQSVQAETQRNGQQFTWFANKRQPPLLVMLKVFLGYVAVFGRRLNSSGDTEHEFA